jgi:hypothetical protein
MLTAISRRENKRFFKAENTENKIPFMHGWLFFFIFLFFSSCLFSLSRARGYFAKLMGTRCIPQAEFSQDWSKLSTSTAAGWNAQGTCAASVCALEKCGYIFA